jgi:hypothetical protein
MLRDYVNRKAHDIDVQFDPKKMPKLPFDPFSPTREAEVVAHYFLMVASVDVGFVVGRAEVARQLLCGLFDSMRKQLFVATQDQFEEKITRLGIPLVDPRLATVLLGKVNEFVTSACGHDIVGTVSQMESPAAIADLICENIPQLGGRTAPRKRVWMYLRWMVRNYPDLRIFTGFRSNQLYVPLDGNVAKVACAVGLLKTDGLSRLTWSDVEKVTEFGKALIPEDPAKVDYPFFLLGRAMGRYPVNLKDKLMTLLEAE